MNNADIQIGFAPIARPTFDLELARALCDGAYAAIESDGYRIVGSRDLIMDGAAVECRMQELSGAEVDLLVVVQASFADSAMLLDLARAIDKPLLLWAFPEATVGGRLRVNSFCGINLAAHGLRRAGLAYDYIYATPDDPEALEKLSHVAAAAHIKNRLHGARIGRFGENPDGFDTCLVNRAGLRSRFGVEVAQFELDAVFERVRACDAAKVKDLAASVGAGLDGYADVDSKAAHGTLATYLTLRKMADAEKLSGVALRCWPEFFTELGCAACGAMSLLADGKTPSSCEADVNGTITQLILGWISDAPAFGADLVSVDVENNSAVLWHCGLAPLSMADPNVQPQATIHSNRELPLLMQFPLKPGRVTLSRISEATGDFRLVIGGGEMLEAPMAFTGTSGTIRFDSGAQAVMDTIMREGLEHHISLTYGDHGTTLEALARQLGLPVLIL